MQFDPVGVSIAHTNPRYYNAKLEIRQSPGISFSIIVL